MKAVSIYALVDPRNKQVRYVGQSVHPETRLIQHLETGWKANRELGRWLDVLKRRDLAPELRIIEMCRTPAQADQQEAHWIRKYRAKGAELLNRCDGAGRTITKTGLTSKTEWLELATELREVRGEAGVILRRLSAAAGTSKPATETLRKACKSLDDCRANLAAMLTRHFPEWEAELTEALYE